MKLDALVMRDLYSKYKTAPTAEKREQARKEYLDRREYRRNFVGRLSVMIKTGACHAPVNTR